MEILYLLIPVSIVLVFVIGAIFWWALSNQQFEGLDEEASRILQEDDHILASRPVPATMPATDPPAAQDPDH